MLAPLAAALLIGNGWIRQGPLHDGVVDDGATAFMETSVLHEGGKFRVWHTELYYDAGQAGAPPWNAARIVYRESTDGLTWTSPQPCIDDLNRSCVIHHTDGYYYCAGVTFTSLLAGFGNSVINVYRSATGAPGSWALFAANILPPGTGTAWDAWEFGNLWLHVENGTWTLLYEALYNWQWKAGVANGPSLTALTKYGGNPVMQPPISGGTTSVGMVKKIGSTYYHFGHASDRAATTPTHLLLQSASSLTGPWSVVRWELLLLSQWPSQDAQIADPSVVEVNGQTWLFYETMPDQTDAWFCAARFPGTLAELVALPTAGDDLPQEGWTFDGGYGEQRPSGSYPTTYLRKHPAPVSRGALAVKVLTDGAHALRARRPLVAGSGCRVTWDARVEQTTRRLDLRLDRDATNGILCGVWFDTDGTLKYWSGTTPATAQAYQAGRFYVIQLELGPAGWNLTVDGVRRASGIPYYAAGTAQYAKVEQTAGATSYLGALFVEEEARGALSITGSLTDTWEVLPLTDPVPSAPASLTATPGNGQVTLVWPASAGATSYHLYRAEAPAVDVATATKLAGVTSPHADTGRTNGTAYYYVATASNAAGESGPGPEVSATPQAPATVRRQDWIT